MIRELAERSRGAWTPSSGAVYPALAQLEDEGLVEPDEAAGRKHFRLSEAGRREVETLGDRARPWDEAAREASDGPAADDMWEATRQLVTAVRAVVDAGDDELSARAAEELQTLRRTLYAMLAEPRPRG